MSMNRLIRLLVECEQLEFQHAPSHKIFTVDYIMTRDRAEADRQLAEARQQAEKNDIIIIVHSLEDNKAALERQAEIERLYPELTVGD